MTLGAVTIDLDGAGHYHAIHGLPPPERDILLARALPRFLDLCRAAGVRATLFCIGKDMEDPAVATLVAQAHEEGHEIASHSFAHDYRMTQFTRAAMRADLADARDAIARVTGVPPQGFRAPGYNLNPALLDAVVEAGHRYDSSVFPSPPYYVARSVAITGYALQGRPSRSLRGDPRQFTAPRRPYRPRKGDIFRRGGTPLPIWELPMAVALPLGLPMIGTFLGGVYPPHVRRGLTWLRTHTGGPFNLELHAMDLAGDEDGLSPRLPQFQPDLQVPLAERLEALRDVVHGMRGRLEVLPLRDWLPRLES
ncbi:MAG: polysaccharide deacetylase family protein [Deltaproteobacteria bacterium]|nr:polysaccharide deacetylase family protein [Deltaproteobacteria bacterium]